MKLLPHHKKVSKRETERKNEDETKADYFT